MIDANQDKFLRQIFSDAHVIDVDFSLWDKCISLCVIADHVESTIPGKLPILFVEFVKVRRFACDFHHVGIELGLGYNEDDKHIQWLIDSIILESNDDTISISLSQGGIFPKLHLVCEKIAIRQLTHSLLDSLFPEWSLPYSGLARPGIEAMGQLRHNKSNQTPSTDIDLSS